MTKKDLSEIRKTIAKDVYTFDRFAACTFDTDRSMSPITSGMFGQLPEEEIDRYLDILKKTVTGSIGKTLVNADIEDESSESYELLEELKSTGLKDEDVVKKFFERVGTHYLEGTEQNGFAVIIAHGMYDIPAKANDNADLGESEDVYEHIIVAICPMALQKPSLGVEDDRIAELTRKWQIGSPTEGFLYPAFEDREPDVHKMLVFMKKEFDTSLMSEVMALNADALAPADAQTEFVNNVITDGDEISLDTAAELANNIADMKKDMPELDKGDLKDLLEKSGVENLDDFDDSFDEALGTDTKVTTDNLSLAKDAVITIGDFTLKGPATALSNLDIKNGHLMIPVEGDMALNGMTLSAR